MSKCGAERKVNLQLSIYLTAEKWFLFEWKFDGNETLSDDENFCLADQMIWTLIN